MRVTAQERDDLRRIHAQAGCGERHPDFTPALRGRRVQVQEPIKILPYAPGNVEPGIPGK
jgi:hypothetical protein